MRGTVSILGLLDYSPEVLDGIGDYLPSGVSLEHLKDAIILECAELEILIPNPALFAGLVKRWAARKSLSWTRYYAAIHATYNPLENYDRQEQEAIQESGENSAESAGTTAGTDEEKVSAFNSGTYQPKTQVTRLGNADTETSGDFSRNLNRSGRIHGNIGVTTSQQMLAAELDITPRLDIYEKIVADFKAQFCILVY